MSQISATVHIQPRYLALIASGQKTVEGRLARSPYDSIRANDIVRFESSTSDGLTVAIGRVSSYPSFEAMLVAEGLDSCLPDSGLSLAEAVELYRSFPGYRDGEQEHGALVSTIYHSSEVRERTLSNACLRPSP